MTSGGQLSLLHLRLHLVPEAELRLPAYNKGNALRGGFGSAFRKLVCVDLYWECDACTLRFACPYTKVFNPFIPPDAPQFSGNQNIPRPFVFRPPLSLQTAYTAGKPLVFDLVIVGQAIDYLPYFIVAFRELGVSGFGLNRAHVHLARVESLDHNGTATLVYDGTSNVVRPAAPMEFDVDGKNVVGRRSSVDGKNVDGNRSPVAGTASFLPPRLMGEGLRTNYQRPTTGDILTLDFLTPTTLTVGSTIGHSGNIVRHPAFHHVIKRLRDRVNALATFYGGGPLALDFKAVGQAAENIVTVEDQTHWVERERFSRHRAVRHDLSGFVGSLRVRGSLAPFLSLLRIGEYVHVGKNAVFGNGWFVVKT